MKFNRKEILSIPNCMSYFRLLLIPLFCITYIRAKVISDYYIPAVIVVISALTDFLDGKIARKYNMITELGKFIDPVADKLTHGAIAICLMFKYQFMKYLVIVMILKEAYMLIMGAINLKHGKKLNGAKMHGKICTTSVFIVLAILVLFPGISETTAAIMIFIEIIIHAVTWLLYTMEFRRMRLTWDN